MAPGSRSSSEPGTRSAKTRTPWVEATSKPAAARRASASSAVNRCPVRPVSAPFVEEREGLREVAGHGPGDDGGVPLGDQEREGAAGAEHLADRGQRRGRVVDDLEHAVAEHHVDRAADGVLHEGRQVGEVALETGDVDTDLAGPAAERGERVGAGVDHGDPVAELGEPDREPAGPAADVDDAAALRRSSARSSASHTTAVRALARRSLGRSLAMQP